MPLSKLQISILDIIASRRSPNSYVAGGAPLNRSGPRVSDDVDIFHGSELAAAESAEADVALLREAGYSVEWLRRSGSIYSAQVTRESESTKLEWVADSDYRYFPATPDPQFGFVLHPVDLAVNKLMAAASRREPRDLVDLLRIHARYMPLGAIVCAATEVAPGFTPEGLLAELKRNCRYNPEDIRALKSVADFDATEFMTAFRMAVAEAEEFVALMPSDALGCVYLEDGRPVQPNPDRLEQYVKHYPKRFGHWPTSAELTTAMLDQLQEIKP